MNSDITANIHSIESLGLFDGPGLRSVIFFQDCSMKCLFCHNIDCAVATEGTQYTVKQLIDKVMKYSDYWYRDGVLNGGITLSGGEPLMQSPFLIQFVSEIKKLGVSIAIDTNLLTSKSIIDKLLPHIDFWMPTIKHMDSERHKWLTGVDNSVILSNFKYLNDSIGNLKAQGKFAGSIRLRYLLIPGITDTDDNLQALRKFIKPLKNVNEVEILKYTDIGKYKWQELFGRYELKNIRNATQEDVLKAYTILQSCCDNCIM
jgi:pyruvate formate lyase activating enzyme